ncbi:MAG: WecB/TagA/CpsF family glycosyltransferase [Spirulina sp. SIO3F2]|nr:WecB/TagA/CpsF family glycosyltransferase [Spirulina sp. SIO3F2]
MTYKILCSYGVLHSFFFGHRNDREREGFELALDKLKESNTTYSLFTTELDFGHLRLALKTRARNRWSDDAESRLRSVVKPIEINENIIRRAASIRRNQTFDFEMSLLISCAQHAKMNVVIQVQSLLPQQLIQYEGVELCTSEYLLLKLRLDLVNSSNTAEEKQAYLTANYNILCGFSIFELFFFNGENQECQDFELFLARAESAFFTSPRIFVTEPDFDFLVFCLHQKSGEDILDIEAQLRAIINPLEISFNDLSTAFELHALRGFDLETAILITCACRENLTWIIQSEKLILPELTGFDDVKIQTPRQLLARVFAQLALYNVEPGEEQSFSKQEDLEKQKTRKKKEPIDLCMDRIRVWIENQENRAVCFADLRLFAEFAKNKNEKFKQAFRESIDLVPPSGTPISLMLKLREHVDLSVKEAKFLKKIINYCSEHDKKITLLADKENELQKFADKLSVDSDDPITTHKVDLCHIPNSESLPNEKLKEIQLTQPDVILVSLPNPIQSHWLVNNYHRFNVPVVGIADGLFLYNDSICLSNKPFLFSLLQYSCLEWTLHYHHDNASGGNYFRAFCSLIKEISNGFENSHCFLKHIHETVAA